MGIQWPLDELPEKQEAAEVRLKAHNPRQLFSLVYKKAAEPMAFLGKLFVTGCLQGRLEETTGLSSQSGSRARRRNGAG